MANTVIINSKNLLPDGSISINVSLNIGGTIYSRDISFPPGTTSDFITQGISNTIATIISQNTNLVTSQSTYDGIVLNSEISL